MRYRLSERAENDLTDIWVYSFEQWGVDQADRYIDALVSRFDWLGGNVALCKPRPDLSDELYSYRQQSHMMYFRASRDGDTPDLIEIVRVLRGRMEPAGRVQGVGNFADAQ